MRKSLVAVLLLAIVLLTILAWFWTRTPTPSEEPVINKVELINSLYYIRDSGFEDEAEASGYVVVKAWLKSPIDDQQEIIDYLDSRQWEDGGWGYWEPSHLRPMMSRLVLLAYVILNATPQKSLDPFLSQYDTREEADQYLEGRLSSAYHLFFSWAAYYKRLPSWEDEFFLKSENNLSWTTDESRHYRSHVLYSYLIARRDYPNLDGIIDATLSQQRSDGSWTPAPDKTGFMHETGIQIHLLKSIIILYPGHRTSEIQEAIDKAKYVLADNYNTTIIDDKECGYFIDPRDGNPLQGDGGRVGNMFIPVFGGILSGLVEGDADPLFDGLYQALEE